jgi:succinyl-CoA synthetase beta subunit
MRLHEYQSKEIFSRYGIPTPKGVLCASPEDAAKAVSSFTNAVIKAQALVGGRKKAGGIITVSQNNANENIAHIFGLKIKGLPVKKALVEKLVDIKEEFYISIALDKKSRRALLMASASGGVDIEEMARISPRLILKESIDPLLGPQPHQLINTAKHLGFSDQAPLSEIIINLYAAYDGLDCTLAEINPLALTKDNRLVALDAKINIDDNALFRQPTMQGLYEQNFDDLDYPEVQAQKLGMSYISLNGNIGCIVNGAGLALATLDMIARAGGTPANFMDVRGGADAFHVGRSVEITTSNPETKVLVINMFGGLTLCDEIAEGIRSNLRELDIPVVIRLSGTNQEKGWEILRSSNVTVTHTTAEAARIAVEMAS